MTIILICILNFSLINNLWDQSYLDLVESDWEKAPITQVKILNEDDYCDFSTMKREGENKAGYYDDFEILGQGKWWGFKMGCACNSGSKWPNTDTRRCLDEQTAQYCWNVYY